MDPIRIFCDNMTSIYLAHNLVFHARTKHMEVHYHFIHERIQATEIDLLHVSTNLQIADIFTKALGIDKLRQFASGLGLTPSALPSLRGSVNTQRIESATRLDRTETTPRLTEVVFEGAC